MDETVRLDLDRFKSELLGHLPALRAFAWSLCGDPVRADDLVQETVLKAWANRQSYTLGSNMKAWLFTILRNGFYNEVRRRKRQVEDPDGEHTKNLAVEPAQQRGLEIQDLRRGLARLPDEQREAIILVGASGCSYEEAARICGCALGTIKSRVSRARRALLNYFEDHEAEALLGAGETEGGGDSRSGSSSSQNADTKPT